MSLLIQGMPMPDKPATLRIMPDGKVWLMEGSKKKLRATEIPTPHGRLIDADEVSGKIGGLSVVWSYHEYHSCTDDCLEIVRYAPTVIEAEGEKE